MEDRYWLPQVDKYFWLEVMDRLERGFRLRISTKDGYLVLGWNA